MASTIEGIYPRRIPNPTDGVPLSPNGWCFASDIAALSPNASGVPTVNAVSFGADPTGTVDSGPAINAAIASLPVTGGDVYLGNGNFKIATTVVVGDGTTSTPSTRAGINLVGACTAQGSSYYVHTGPTNGTCRLFTSNAIDLLHINGPLQGWGLHNIHFDGASVGLVGITEQSAQWGISRGCRISGFTTVGQLTKAIPNPGGAFVGAVPNNMHNRYESWVVEVPNVNGAHGIWLRGNGTDSTTNTCFDEWDDLTVTLATATAGHQITAVRIGWTDTNFFSKVHMIPNGSSGGGSYRIIVWDYTDLAGDARLPSSNFFKHITFDGHVSNVGSPSGSPGPNNIALIASANGVPSDPSLSNLSWGITAANP